MPEEAAPQHQVVLDVQGIPPFPPIPDVPHKDRLSQMYDKYHRDIRLAGLSLIAGIILSVIVNFAFLQHPMADIRDVPDQNVVSQIYLDAYWFHQLYMRWTVVDWLLTFLATGTAVAAVIKNSVSVKSTGNAGTSLSRLDRLLIFMAVMTILAGIFDSKLHAGQSAAQYRKGDLLLQRAKMDYAGSAKDSAAIAVLLKKWGDAQNALDPPSVVVQPPPPAPTSTQPPTPLLPGTPAPTNTVAAPPVPRPAPGTIAPTVTKRANPNSPPHQ